MKMFSVCGTYALLSSCGPVGQWVMSSLRAINKHVVATESVMPMVTYMAINLWKLLALHRRAALDYARAHRNTTNPKIGGSQRTVEAVHVAMALLLEHCNVVGQVDLCGTDLRMQYKTKSRGLNPHIFGRSYCVLRVLSVACELGLLAKVETADGMVECAGLALPLSMVQAPGNRVPRLPCVSLNDENTIRIIRPSVWDDVAAVLEIWRDGACVLHTVSLPSDFGLDSRVACLLYWPPAV